MKNITHFLKWDCSDPGFRGKKAIDSLRIFINEIVTLKGKPYVLSNAGVTLTYIHGNNQTINDNWKNNIDVIIKNAGVELIIIVQHEECLAYQIFYGGKLSPKNEAQKQKDDMQKAKTIINKKYPDIKVILIYGHITNRAKRQFVYSQIF